MRTSATKSALLFLLMIVARHSFGATRDAAPVGTSEPREVSYCELSRTPSAFNHQFVRLTGFITHGFEDFQFADPGCPTQDFSVWITYGGKTRSGTAYCCPGETGEKTRPEPLTVEGVQVPLEDDPTFQRFTALINKETDTTVHGTFVGWFFSGKKEEIGGRPLWRGFGHMGCCSLLVIQRVESLEAHSRADLDYTAEAGWYESEGCKWGSMRNLSHISIGYSDEARRAIEQQESAETGKSKWRFHDPKQVALEAVSPFYPGQNPVLNSVKSTPSREVFRWQNGSKGIVVVVTRPYWLSFYADSDAVVWVASMIKEADCEN